MKIVRASLSCKRRTRAPDGRGTRGSSINIVESRWTGGRSSVPLNNRLLTVNPVVMRAPEECGEMMIDTETVYVC